VFSTKVGHLTSQIKAEYTNLSYTELAKHYKEECPNVQIECHSCGGSSARKDFQQHECFTKLRHLEQNQMGNKKSELLQILLEV